MSVDYDAELVRYMAVLRRNWCIEPDDRIVDVGCGTGETTREAARAAPLGRVLGVDVSAGAIEQARVLARDAGLANVDFEVGDAQTFEFGGFDVAVSRFGTMFFADPTAAFSNIAGALRPGGRLVMLVWQPGERNAWHVAIRGAIGHPPAQGPDAFSLGEPALVRETLEGAGFADVVLTDVCEPVYYGPDPGAAVDWISGFGVLQPLDPETRNRALDRLRETCAGLLREDGVWFDARAWLVTARTAELG